MASSATATTTADLAMRHRIAEATVTVLGPDGRPLRSTEVTVAQTRHDFLFGNIGFDFIPLANGETGDPAAAPPPFGGAGSRLDELAERWFELFNQATLPFYWGGFEPVAGRPDTERLRRTAQWFVDRGVVVKGHPLVWHTLTAPWLVDL